MADMSPMAEDLDTNHNDNNHSPAGSAGSVGSGGSTGAGIPMLVVHKREMVQILEDHHHQQENNHHQHGSHMEADDDGQPSDDQDTDGDALSPQKRPLNNNNNDVATVFLIDTSEVGPGHDDADQAVEVDEVCQLIQIFPPFFTISLVSRTACVEAACSATSYFDVGKNRAEEEREKNINPKAGGCLVGSRRPRPLMMLGPSSFSSSSSLFCVMFSPCGGCVRVGDIPHRNLLSFPLLHRENAVHLGKARNRLVRQFQRRQGQLTLTITKLTRRRSPTHFTVCVSV